MPLEEYKKLAKAHNMGYFWCLRTILQIMLQQAPRHMPVIGRPTVCSPRHMSRGSIVTLTSLASEGTFLGVETYIPVKDPLNRLVQAGGKLAIALQIMG